MSQTTDASPTLNSAIAIEYRRRHLQFLSALGAGVGVAMIVMTIAWGMWEVAVPSFFYGPVCLYTIVMLRRKPEWIGGLTQLFIFATVVVTQTGVFLQKPGAVTDPWIMTCPLVAYGLTDRKTAAAWTALTLALLFILRPFQPYHSVTWQTTAVLALAITSFAVVQHLYSRRTEDNERLIVQLGNTDALTGTLNRRSFDDTLQAEFRRNLRLRFPMTVFMIDADHFKTYNDRYGHMAGDKVLVSIANVLKHTARRSGDFVFRYGGEEFCVICSGLEEAQAATFAEQLRANIEALGLDHADAPSGKISVSIGFRHLPFLANISPERLVEEADKALYLAKAKGRNRVEAYADNFPRDTAPGPHQIPASEKGSVDS